MLRFDFNVMKSLEEWEGREKGGDGSGAPYPHVAFKSRPLASVTATQRQPKSTVTAPRLSPPPRRLSPPSLQCPHPYPLR